MIKRPVEHSALRRSVLTKCASSYSVLKAVSAFGKMNNARRIRFIRLMDRYGIFGKIPSASMYRDRPVADALRDLIRRQLYGASTDPGQYSYPLERFLKTPRISGSVDKGVTAIESSIPAVTDQYYRGRVLSAPASQIPTTRFGYPGDVDFKKPSLRTVLDAWRETAAKRKERASAMLDSMKAVPYGIKI